MRISPFPISRTGKWWGFYRENGEKKGLEIDIVALNELENVLAQV